MNYNTVPIDVLSTIVDYNPETGSLTWKISTSNRVAAGKAVGSVKSNGYIETQVLGVRLHAHRIAWAIYHGEWPLKQVDHINGNRQDNRIANLRLASNAENQWNRKPTKRNKSGVNGVFQMKRSGKWCAQITIMGKILHLGVFDNLEDAAEARKIAEARYHDGRARQLCGGRRQSNL